MKLSAVLIATTLFASGCASVTDKQGDWSGDQSLVLNVPVTIPAGAATLRIQFGRPTAFNAVQEPYPFCVFELNTVSPTPQVVQPGRYRIIRISRSVEIFAGMPVLRVIPVAFGHDDVPSQIYYKTRFQLDDPRHRARALTCMSDQNAPGNAIFMRHLSLREIDDALGTVFTLNLHAAV